MYAAMHTAHHTRRATSSFPLCASPLSHPLPQGNSLTTMLAALNPSPDNAEECFNTLQVRSPCCLALPMVLHHFYLPCAYGAGVQGMIDRSDILCGDREVNLVLP